jgi:hypothetical protein
VRCSVTTTDLRRRPRKIVHRPRLGKCLASLLSGYGDPTGRAPDPAIDYVVISDEAACHRRGHQDLMRKALVRDWICTISGLSSLWGRGIMEINY